MRAVGRQDERTESPAGPGAVPTRQFGLVENRSNGRDALARLDGVPVYRSGHGASRFVQKDTASESVMLAVWA